MNMKQLLRRSLAGFCSLVMCCVIFPSAAFAAEGETETPYNIQSESSFTATALENEDPSLAALKGAAAGRLLGGEMDWEEYMPIYGNLLSPFTITSEDAAITFTMDKPTGFDNDMAEGQGYTGCQIIVQEGPNGPIFAYPVEVDEGTLKATIPVGGKTMTCAIVQSRAPESPHNKAERTDDNSAPFAYTWFFDIDENAARRVSGQMGYSYFSGEIHFDLGDCLSLDDVSFESQAFQLGEPEQLSDGSWRVPLERPDGKTQNDVLSTELLTAGGTLSIKATFADGTELEPGQVVTVVSEVLIQRWQTSDHTGGTPSASFSSTAPLVQQCVIGINYVDVDTDETVGTGAALAGEDATTISVEGLPIPKGYELALDEGETTVKIDDESHVATVPVRMKKFTIKTVVGPNGSITPEGLVTVKAGENKTFTFKPNSGYQVNTVMVDDKSVAITDNTYTFTNVNANHEIVVTFEKKSSPPIIIPDDDDDQPEDPDDTGVSDLLNTKDHDQYLFGYPDGTFGPGLNMTRAEAAQMFYNLLVDQDVTAKPVFDDVPEGAWYAEPVNVMAKLDIVEGVGDDKFEPDREITRAEFTAMAMRFAEGETGGKNIFSDVDEDDWFYDVVVDSIKYGWIEGYPDGTFRPQNLITREEVTTIVNRMLGRLPDEKFIDAHEDDLDLFPDVTKNWAYYDVVEATNDHQYKKTSSGEDWTKLG